MTTKEIIEAFNQIIVIDSEDYDSLERIEELTDFLEENKDGHLACEAMLNLLERHPHIEFGKPGQPIHALESYRGHYEDLLMTSLDRRPTFMTIWMFNRIINGAKSPKKEKLIEKLKSFMSHPLADEQAKEMAKDFYAFQTG